MSIAEVAHLDARLLRAGLVQQIAGAAAVCRGGGGGEWGDEWPVAAWGWWGQCTMRGWAPDPTSPPHGAALLTLHLRSGAIHPGCSSTRWRSGCQLSAWEARKSASLYTCRGSCPPATSAAAGSWCATCTPPRPPPKPQSPLLLGPGPPPRRPHAAAASEGRPEGGCATDS